MLAITIGTISAAISVYLFLVGIAYLCRSKNCDVYGIHITFALISFGGSFIILPLTVLLLAGMSYCGVL
jgi:hypothetical protein